MAHNRRVFISACEVSADAHAAALLRRAHELLPDCEFYGLAGPQMRAAGADTLYDFAAHAAMLSGVLLVIGRAREALRVVAHSWRARPPDAVVLLDSPELHLRLARLARRLGLPVLYYIAPQTWATRAYRNRQIARYVDRLACILPFEEDYFRAAGVPAEFVGHPLFEALAQQKPDEQAVQGLRDGHGPLVALLPGSRSHVIEAMLPRQLDVLRRMQAQPPAPRLAVSCVSAAQRPRIERHLSAAQLPAEVVVADNASLLTAADLVLVASGTATLEVAYHRKPMVVMYDGGRLLEWPYRLFGRWVLKLPHLSLVNILADARVVPEFMPFLRDTHPVAAVAARLLHDQQWRALMSRQLADVVRPLLASQASTRVCGIIAELLGQPAGSS